MKVCMLMYRSAPRFIRRVIVANAIYRKYHNVDVIAIKEEGQGYCENIDGVNYYRLPILLNFQDRKIIRGIKLGLFTLFSFLWLIPHFAKNRYDVIHVHNPPDFLIFSALPYKLIFGTKVVLDLHDMLPEAVMSNLNVSEDNLLTKISVIIEKVAVRFSDSIICTNNFDKEIILSRNTIDPNIISVVMNTPDLDLMGISHEETEPNQSLNKFRVLFEGTIWNRRGIKTVIDAIESVKDSIPIEFYVIGDGPDLNDIQEYVASKNLDQFVHFTGWVNYCDLSSYISASNVCIIPFLRTKVNERGVPNKLFEYIVHEKPVLSSRLKGISLTFNEDEVIFFEPGDAEDLANKLRWCYENHDELINITQKAKDRYFAEYTWERMENELYRCYDTITQSVIHP